MSWTPGFLVPLPNTSDGSVPDLSGTYVTQVEFDEQGPSGRLLDSAETTVYQSGIGSTVADITGLSITFTVSSRPVVVTLTTPYVLASGAATIYVQITDAAGTATRLSASAVTGSNLPQSILVEEEISTPGTYTRKAQIGRLAGTGLVANNYPGVAETVVSRLSAQEQ